MKNTLKRILLILPVISVLLVVLAVPAFADGIDGGLVDPVTFDQCVYFVDENVSSRKFIDVTLGDSFSLEGGNSYLFSYLLDVDVSSMNGVSIDISAGYPFSISIERTNGNVENKMISRIDSDGTGVRIYTYVSSGYDGYYATMTVSDIRSLRILCTEDLLPYLADVDYTYYTVASSPTEHIGNVWTEILTWIISALNSVMGAFYVDGSLTLLGTLAVIGVSVGIGFLLIGLIQRFLKLRG